MTRRANSLGSTPTAISREIDSQYDNVKIVADNIDDVNKVAEYADDIVNVSDNITSIANTLVTALDDLAVVESTATTARDETLAARDETLLTRDEAVTSASSASVSELNAQTSATNAAISESNASTSEANAATSATASEASAIASATSEANATASELAASTSETNASNSEVNALAHENMAQEWASKTVDVPVTGYVDTYSALHYATKAKEEAEASAVSSGVASAAETSSAASASAAAVSEANALTSETNALNSATNASTSEVNAATSEANASASETAAALSETNAANSATVAGISESNALTSANNAEASRSAAETAKLAAEGFFDQFSDVYLGTWSSDPVTDNDGDPLVEGTFYYNNGITPGLRIYTGTEWDPAVLGITNSVTSFNGRDGTVLLNNLDVTTATGQALDETGTPKFASVQLTGGVNPTDGTLSWNNEDETLDLVTGPDTTYQLGQELGVVARNLSGVTITNGTVVRVLGASGSKITIDTADNASSATSDTSFAVVTQSIANNDTGKVTTEGLVRGLDTSAYAEGTSLWLGTAGGYTSVQPISPAVTVHVGWVVRSHASEGSIYVKIDKVGNLEYSNDVLVNAPQDGDFLGWNSVTSLWENKSIDKPYVDALGINANTLDGFDSTYFEPADPTIVKDADVGITVQPFNADTVVDSNYVHTDSNFTALEKTKLSGIEEGAQVNDVTSVSGKVGAVTLDKADVGLDQVDNTSDLNKPISTATQVALDTKVSASTAFVYSLIF